MRVALVNTDNFEGLVSMDKIEVIVKIYQLIKLRPEIAGPAQVTDLGSLSMGLKGLRYPSQSPDQGRQFPGATLSIDNSFNFVHKH